MCENRDRNCRTVRYVKLCNNYNIRKPLSARNKQTNKRNEQNEITKQQTFSQTALTQKLTVE